MPIIDTVLLKVASRCNLNCSYCYVYNMGDTGWASMPKRMSSATMESVARALARLFDWQRVPFAVVLHGGEPLLLGNERLRDLFALIRGVLPGECTLNIQTNGTLIDQSVLDLCAQYDATISISIDGPEQVHDRARRDRRGHGTHHRVIDGITKVKNHPRGDHLLSGVLAVIDPTADAGEVYKYLKSLGAPTIDLLLKDGNHSRLPPGKDSYHSTEFGEWLCQFIDLYLTDPAPPIIRLLDDVVKLLLGGKGRKEGVGLTDYGILVIDTDGSVTKNDTLKSSYDGADRFAKAWSTDIDDVVEVVSSSEFREYHQLQRPTSPECRKCPELSVCGGGMPLHRWRDDNGYANPSVYCHDQKLLIGHIRRRLREYLSAA